jgi:hypothetical protein
MTDREAERRRARRAAREVEEAAQARFLRRFRIAEVVVTVLVLVVVVLRLVGLGSAESRSSEVTSALSAIMIVLGVQGAVMTRVGLQVYLTASDSRLQRTPPYRVWVVTPFSPVLVLLAVLPWVLGGSFGPGHSVAGSLWLLFLLFVLAAGLGLLAVPAVLAPLELLGRGVGKVVRGTGARTRREGAGYVRGALYLGAITLFVLVVAGGVDLGGSGRVAWSSAVLAVLGLPGDHDVRNPALLWIGRAMLLVLAARFVTAWVGRREKDG